MSAVDLTEFAAALSRSIECMFCEYSGDPNLLLWTRELLIDAAGICGGGDRAELLRRQVWYRLKAETRAILLEQATEHSNLSSLDPISPPKPRQKAA